MNTTPCNNCIGNLSLFPKPVDTRIDRKLFGISSSQNTTIKSSLIVSQMAAYGQNINAHRVAGGPGDLIGSGPNGMSGVDAKHGGFFRYLMRKRAAYTRCGSCGGN